MFLIYVLVHNRINRRSHLKGKSHGSAFIRQGAFVFGSGALSIAAMALATLLFNENAGTLRIVNAALSLTFVVLQVIILLSFFIRNNVTMETNETNEKFSLISDVGNNFVSKTQSCFRLWNSSFWVHAFIVN